jgi:hypothetical protein
MEVEGVVKGAMFTVCSQQQRLLDIIVRPASTGAVWVTHFILLALWISASAFGNGPPLQRNIFGKWQW